MKHHYRKLWLSLLLIVTLLAAGMEISPVEYSAPQTAHAQNYAQPLVFLKDGDLWAWDGASVRQLTTWGYNERPIMSPDGTRVAYNSWAQLVVDYLAANPGIAGFLPSNIWVINPATGDAQRVADQPADASFLQPGVTDRHTVRGTPEWSPDGSQLAWAELLIPDFTYQLVIHNFATGTQQVLVPQLPYPWADAGNVSMPTIMWSQTGIGVLVTAANGASGDFEERLYLYATNGSLVHDTLIGGSATEWPATRGWINANGQEFFGVTYGSGKAYLFNATTGEQSPMPGVPEWYSTSANANSVTAYPSASLDSTNNLTRQWTAVYPDRTQEQALPFEGTTNSLAIAPDGRALAYIADAVYVWANGSTTQVPGTEGIGSSWDVGVVWGPNSWRTRDTVVLDPASGGAGVGSGGDTGGIGSGGAGETSGAGGGIYYCSPTPRLTLGAAAQVLPGLPNVIRTLPRRGSDSIIIGEIPGGGIVAVEGGPVCGPEGRYWWQIDYQGIKGWTAEGQGGVYWMDKIYTSPATCWMQPRLTVGSTAQITPGIPNVIRTQPRRGADSPVIGWIPGNGVFKVLSGPQCGPEGRYWWQVEYAGVTGWTAEGENGIYWAQPFGCPASPPPRLYAGMQARITPGLPNNLRNAPSSTATAIGQIPAGGIFTVLSGPVCGAEGWSYWRVQYGGLIGWTAEGDGGTYWIEPLGINVPLPPTPTPQPAACTLPPRMIIGVGGRVLPGLPNVIRSQPRRGADSYVIFEMPAGASFGVISGPVCGPEGRYWWQVGYGLDITGWTPEGEGTTYWIEPFPGDGPGTGICNLSPHLAVGIQGRVLPGEPNTLRSEPNAYATAIGQIPAGGIFTVLEGPICSVEGWHFWRVQYGSQVGWTAEGNTVTYWLEPLGYPGTTCNPAPRLQIAGNGRVLPGDPNVLRNMPGTGASSSVIGQIPGGGVFTVFDGPQCGNDGRYWWYVSYNGTLGWTAEGEGGTYWVEPLY